MKTPPFETLVDLFKINQSVIHREIAGITQAESLIQPPYPGNCLNWVLGHILTGRDTCLRLLGLAQELAPEEYARYDRGSEPLKMPELALDIKDLKAKLDRSHKTLLSRLEEIGTAGLEAEVEFGRGREPLGGAIAFLQWHEAYHTGQLDLLRQVAGKNDRVI